jgi:enoyl-CoA hydratase
MPVETVHLETEGRIATVTLDRPSAGNAIDEPTAQQLREVCGRVAVDDEVRVVVLTGAGDFFCVGADGPSFEDPGSLRVANHLAGLEKPLIAALNGDAVGLGLELALACDIRVASSEARMGLTQVGDGAMPWDGGTQRLPRLVGRGRAMEMVLTSRLVDAQEALEIGLVNRVVEPDRVLRRSLDVASTIAGQGPIAARYLKEAVLKGLDMTLEQGLRLEADLSFLLQSTTDRAEGIQSFLEKRKPEYKGE